MLQILIKTEDEETLMLCVGLISTILAGKRRTVLVSMVMDKMVFMKGRVRKALPSLDTMWSNS